METDLTTEKFIHIEEILDKAAEIELLEKSSTM